LLAITTSCTPKKINHKVGGEAKIKMIIEQDICTDENGFKKDVDKRECVMAFINCKNIGGASGNSADEN